MTGTPFNNRRMLTVVQMDEGLLAACQQRLVYTAGSLCSIKGCIQMYTRNMLPKMMKICVYVAFTHPYNQNESKDDTKTKFAVTSNYLKIPAFCCKSFVQKR